MTGSQPYRSHSRPEWASATCEAIVAEFAHFAQRCDRVSYAVVRQDGASNAVCREHYERWLAQ